MRKQELIHLHGLFAEVGRYYEREGTPAIDLSEYESLSVTTSSIHRSKGAHQKAVFTLTDAITETIRHQRRVVSSSEAS